MEPNKELLKKNAIDNFLGEENIENSECNTEECKIKKDKSIVERLSKKIITEDGRQLLI